MENMEDMEEETYPLTEIDQIANGRELLMLKAMLPYLPYGGSPTFAVLIKLMEIQNIRSYYQNRPQAELCAMSAANFSMTDMLQNMIRFCPKEQREMFRQFHNVMEMAQMFGTMQDMFGGEFSYGESEQRTDSYTEQPTTEQSTAEQSTAEQRSIAEPSTESKWMDE